MGELKKIVEDVNVPHIINDFYADICLLENKDIDDIEGYLLEKLVERGRTVSDITGKGPSLLGPNKKISRKFLSHANDKAGELKGHIKRVGKMPLDYINKFGDALLKKPEDDRNVVGRVKDFFNKARSDREGRENKRTKYDLNDTIQPERRRSKEFHNQGTNAIQVRKPDAYAYNPKRGINAEV